MHIEAISGKGSFQIIKGAMTLLEIKSTNWFSTRVVTRFRGVNYEINPNNFWRTKFEILKNKTKKGDLHYNWKGHISLNLWDESLGREKHYVLKAKGFLKRYFNLLDEEENVVLVLRSKLNWRKFGYNYEIEDFHVFDVEEELPEMLIYCGFAANLYMSKKAQQSAG
jgi:hypothetical protein